LEYAHRFAHGESRALSRLFFDGRVELPMGGLLTRAAVLDHISRVAESPAIGLLGKVVTVLRNGNPRCLNDGLLLRDCQVVSVGSREGLDMNVAQVEVVTAGGTEIVHLRKICSYCGREATDPRDIVDGIVPISEALKLMRCARCRRVSYCTRVRPDPPFLGGCVMLHHPHHRLVCMGLRAARNSCRHLTLVAENDDYLY
jgi:hypothetical protein